LNSFYGISSKELGKRNSLDGIPLKKLNLDAKVESNGRRVALLATPFKTNFLKKERNLINISSIE